MKETKRTYISDKQSHSIPDTGQVTNLLKLIEGNYQKKENEMLTIKKILPDDHLTAIYWG